MIESLIRGALKQRLVVVVLSLALLAAGFSALKNYLLMLSLTLPTFRF